MLIELKEKFEGYFKEKSEYVYFAPGRVNLIGEYTDINGGFVLPCAINYGTYALVSLRDDQKVCIISENFKNEGIIEFSLDYIEKVDKQWGNYVKGIFDVLSKHDYELNRGLNILFYGNIPNGSGLSSSASIQILVTYLLSDLFKLKIDRVKIAQIAQEAENNFIGVKCGIMDQFIIANGKKANALLIDTNHLNYQLVPLELENISLIITNTNKQRQLTDSKYNERLSECQNALKALQKKLNITCLSMLNEAQFEAYAYLIDNEIERKRARHAVYENQRVIESVNALKLNDLIAFGKLMNESQRSLKENFEVTGVELDTIAAIAYGIEGVIGSRMTGAGFGGCNISLVRNEAVDQFKQVMIESYKQKIGYEPSIMIVKPSNGVERL